MSTVENEGPEQIASSSFSQPSRLLFLRCFLPFLLLFLLLHLRLVVLLLLLYSLFNINNTHTLKHIKRKELVQERESLKNKD